ncbi:MAG: hypothetical protein AAF039_15990 [Bacteroidota bacterium]
MEVIALGEMGMTEQQLKEITLRSLFNKLEGFRKLERDAWERTRMVMWAAITPHTKKETKLSPMDVMELPWDTDIKEDQKMDAKEAAKKRKALWEKIDAEKTKIAM